MIQSLFTRLFGIDRSEYILWIGAVGLLVAAYMGWHEHPSSLLTTVNAGNELEFAVTVSPFELVLRALTVLWAVLLIFTLLWQRRTIIVRRAGLTLLLLHLVFPYFINQWEPERMLDGRLLYLETDRVVQDMENNLQEQQRDWRDNQVFSVTHRIFITSLHLPVEDNWGLRLISPGRQEHVLQNILGVSNAFLNLCTRGWILALVAPLLVLSGLYLRDPEGGSVFVADLKLFIAAALMLLTALLVPRMIGNHLEELGDEAYYRGEQNPALNYWRAAEKWDRALKYSLSFRQKMGQVEKNLACYDCLDAILADAYADLGDLQLPKTLADLERAERIAPHAKELRYWLASILTELGVSAFNRGQFTIAMEYWQRATLYLPIDPLPWYGQAMAQLRLKQFGKAAVALEQVTRLQEFLSFRKLTIRAQTHVMKSWAAYHRGDWLAAYSHYRQSLVPDNW